MLQRRFNQHTFSASRWRAVLALLLFVTCWAATPLRLALPEPVECGKVCCLDNGECCCLLEFEAAHEGETPTRLSRWQAPCPKECSASITVAKEQHVATPARPVLALTLVESVAAAPVWQQQPIHSHVFLHSIAPRAPPVHDSF